MLNLTCPTSWLWYVHSTVIFLPQFRSILWCPQSLNFELTQMWNKRAKKPFWRHMPRNPKKNIFFARVFTGFLRVFTGFLWVRKTRCFSKTRCFWISLRVSTGFLQVTTGFLRGPWVFFTWCFIFPKRSEQVQCCTVKRRFMDHWFLQVPLLGSFDVAPK